MGRSGLYSIPLTGLKNGIHHYNYNVDGTFFRDYPSSQIDECNVYIDLSFEKKNRLFILVFEISGAIATDCDRCGEAFDLPLFSRQQLFVKQGEQKVEELNEDDVVWISESETLLELDDMIYEFVHLSLPVSRRHIDNKDGTPGCDPENLKYFDLDAKYDSIDPRWDALNKLNKE